MRRVLLIALTLLLPAAAEAQKHCKKGIPCGGTCISATKTCHLGTIVPTPERAPAATAALVRQQSHADTLGEWVASSRGHTYYRRGCSGANKLSQANLISFPTEEAAKAAGYRRSAQRGC